MPIGTVFAETVTNINDKCVTDPQDKAEAVRTEYRTGWKLTNCHCFKLSNKVWNDVIAIINQFQAEVAGLKCVCYSVYQWQASCFHNWYLLPWCFHIDQHLNWKSHVDNVLKRVSCKLCTLHRSKPFARSDYIKPLLILLVFDYYDVVWVPSTVSLSSRLLEQIATLLK